MTPYNAHEDRMQSIERRVTDLEGTHHVCEACGCMYGSSLAALACAEDDRALD